MGRPDRMRPLVGPRCRRKDNIKLDLKNIKMGT